MLLLAPTMAELFCSLFYMKYLIAVGFVHTKFFWVQPVGQNHEKSAMKEKTVLLLFFTYSTSMCLHEKKITAGTQNKNSLSRSIDPQGILNVSRLPCNNQ